QQPDEVEGAQDARRCRAEAQRREQMDRRPERGIDLRPVRAVGPGREVHQHVREKQDATEAERAGRDRPEPEALPARQQRARAALGSDLGDEGPQRITSPTSWRARGVSRFAACGWMGHVTTYRRMPWSGGPSCAPVVRRASYRARMPRSAASMRAAPSGRRAIRVNAVIRRASWNGATWRGTTIGSSPSAVTPYRRFTCTTAERGCENIG